MNIQYPTCQQCFDIGYSRFAEPAAILNTENRTPNPYAKGSKTPRNRRSFRSAHLLRLAFAVLLLCVSAEAGTAASAGPDQDFADTNRFATTAAALAYEEKPGPTSQPSLAVPVKGDTPVNIEWRFPARVLDQLAFSLHVQPRAAALSLLRVSFLGADGLVCSHERKGLIPGAWHSLTFTVGVRGDADRMEPRSFTPGRKVEAIRIEMIGAKGRAGDVLLSDFRSVADEGEAAADFPSAPPTVQGLGTAVWLDPARGFALVGLQVAGTWLPAAFGTVYPSFRVVAANGSPYELRCDGPGWTVTSVPRGVNGLAVRYSRDGTCLEVAWTAAPDHVRCEIATLAEGGLRIGEAGADRIFGVPLGREDYGIAANGDLLRPDEGGPLDFSYQGNSDYQIPSVAAARRGRRVFFYKPLTPANVTLITAARTGGASTAWLGGWLHFRPHGFKNPATKLCHRMQAWKVETSGDVNGDGDVDWVDAGLAYRNRYIAPNTRKDAHLRDAYIYYHQEGTYADLAAAVERMDFADGVWWFKGMLDQGPHGDAYIYPVRRNAARGDLGAFKDRIQAAGSRTGPFYSQDCVWMDGGEWPAEMVKLDPDGQPMRYISVPDPKLTIHYLDNVRGLASGLLKERYRRFVEATWLRPGDSLMLDTFACYARPGFHPDYPATAEVETAAKYEIARWLRSEFGVSVAAEGAVEGTQPVIDWATAGYGTRDWIKGKLWNSGFPRKRVPLNTVIYHGSTYFGCDWYNLRQQTPNYAACMLLGGKLWDWSSVNFSRPERLYAHAARRFFNQNIFWSRIADTRIADVDQDGSVWTVRYEDGSVLCTDPENNRFWLEQDGIRYDGFTPFSSKGVMAITRQDDFDITLPVKDDLEVLPSQPFRDRLDVTITKTRKGLARVRGNFSKNPWEEMFLYNEGDRELLKKIEVSPVLLLRRKGTPAP